MPSKSATTSDDDVTEGGIGAAGIEIEGGGGTGILTVVGNDNGFPEWVNGVLDDDSGEIKEQDIILDGAAACI